MTTKIYFKVTWIFKDGRNNIVSDFNVDIDQDVWESLPHVDMEDGEHITHQFGSALRNAFPQFDKMEFTVTALDSFGDITTIDPGSSYSYEVEQLIITYKETHPEGFVIPLEIVQKRSNQEPSFTNAFTAASNVCQICCGSIVGIYFQCVECEDFSICCLCVTSGRHLQHPVIRSTNSKMDRDTVAKLLSASINSKKEDLATKALVDKLKATIMEQGAKIREQDVMIKEQDAARCEAIACLARPRGRVLSPENNKRKSEVTHQCPLPKNLRFEF